jgi:hypothetical protein
MAHIDSTPRVSTGIKDTRMAHRSSSELLLRSRQIVRWVDPVPQDLAGQAHWPPESLNGSLIRIAQHIATLFDHVGASAEGTRRGMD